MKLLVTAFIMVLLALSAGLAGYLLAYETAQSNSSMPEYLVITNAEGVVSANGWVAVVVNNTGLGTVKIVKVLIDNVKQLQVNPILPITIAPDAGAVLNITTDLEAMGTDSYELELLTSKGDSFSTSFSEGYEVSQAGVVLYEANVNFYGNGSLIDIDIGNSGTLDTTIVQVYIGTSSSAMVNQTITPVSLPAGSVQRIEINYSWQLGVTYYFKVVSSTGQSLPWTEQAPTS